MARGLKFVALFFILLVSLWMTSMLHLTEARPLNGLGLPTLAGHDAGDIDGVLEESSGLNVGRRETYTRSTMEILTDSGPSTPGGGHH